MTEPKTSFEGWVSHQSLGEEVVWGRIVFVGWRLRFESDTVTREVPLDANAVNAALDDLEQFGEQGRTVITP